MTNSKKANKTPESRTAGDPTMNCNAFDCTINYFQILGLKEDSTITEINDAYKIHKKIGFIKTPNNGRN